MADKDYDDLSTKREMVRLLVKHATGEQLDAAIDACLDKRLDDAGRRGVLIQTVYGSWYERSAKRPRPSGADLAPTWDDIEQMFLDVHAVAGVPRPPSQPASSDEQSGSQSVTAPMARLPVGVPEPPPRRTSSEEKSELQDIAAQISRSSAGVPEHGNDSMVLVPPPSADRRVEVSR